MSSYEDIHSALVEALQGTTLCPTPREDERTFRDECAMRAMAAMYEGSLRQYVEEVKVVSRDPFETVLAWQAYQLADAMVSERRRRDAQ